MGLIDANDFHKYLVGQYQEIREKARIAGNEYSDHPYFIAYETILAKWIKFTAELKHKEGEIDMATIKDGFVVDIVRLEDLQLRRAHKGLENKMMEVVNTLKKGDAAVIPENAIQYRTLA